MLTKVLSLTTFLVGSAIALPAQQGLEMHQPFPSPVLNAPYTAERVTTTYQKLVDGTQISHEKKVLVARDSLGRTWTQFQVQNNDPLRRDGRKNTAWVVWDPITRLMTDRCDCNHVAWLRHYDAPLVPTTTAREETHNDQAGQRYAYLGPRNDRMRYVITDLPAQDLLGVHTTGTKAVRTVPAGKDGNDRDLTWTVQSWYSSDLKLALFTVVDDPVKGVTKYEFRNLKRDEPDPSLFQVPPGYALKNAASPSSAPATLPASDSYPQ